MFALVGLAALIILCLLVLVYVMRYQSVSIKAECFKIIRFEVMLKSPVAARRAARPKKGSEAELPRGAVGVDRIDRAA